jgi:hypothetical protein
MKSGRVTGHSCSRYYLDNILNKLQETQDHAFVQKLIDAQDGDGNTATHLAALRDARKCIRALLGRGASTDIPNNDGVRAEDLIKELNASKSKPSRPGQQRSSSPFVPDSQQHNSFHDAVSESVGKLATSYQSEAANTVQSRITPLVLEKFQDLAMSFEEEFKEKDEAEKEAQRVLLNTQAELTNVRASISDLEGRLEPEEVAAKVGLDAEAVRQQVLSLVAHQTRMAVADAGEQTMANGSETEDASDALEVRLALAAELQNLLREQRAAEAEYVEALGVVGTGEKIDKYRRLLKSCLGPDDRDMLDANLEDMIKMMEEEAEVGGDGGGGGGGGGGGQPMEIPAI